VNSFEGETFLDGRVRVRQPQTGFRAGLDAVMLAAAVPAETGQNVLELGAGAGTASLCLAARVPGLTLRGIEIDPALVMLANQNAQANAMVGVQFVESDLFALPQALKRDFDQVLANPPFHGPGRASPDSARTRALMDEGKLADWLLAGLKRTVSGGSFTAILRADRLGEALAALPSSGSILFPLWPREGEAAKRIIVRVVKGSGAALTLSPGLVLHRPDGSWTPEADAILRCGAALALT
jgi:tRNA1Val (adenine37-N6)-methyltransferase